MGIHINPRDMTKEEWLARHGTEVEPVWSLADPAKALVCLVDNGLFTAAGVILDDDEWVAITDPDDPRPRRWFLVEREELKEVITG